MRPPDRAPECPGWLDDESRAAWAYLVPMLRAMGVLTRIDGNALTRYCRTWARWKKMEQFIDKHGETYPLKDEKGRIKCIQQFPQVSIAHKASLLLGKLEQEFGLTPSARSRISLAASQANAPQTGKSRFFGANASA